MLCHIWQRLGLALAEDQQSGVRLDDAQTNTAALPSRAQPQSGRGRHANTNSQTRRPHLNAQVGDIEKRQTAEKEREERKAAKDAEVAAAERVKNAEVRSAS